MCVYMYGIRSLVMLCIYIVYKIGVDSGAHIDYGDFSFSPHLKRAIGP